jgi:nitroreductase/glycosyltransferase involved in cell wall biosynthesis
MRISLVILTRNEIVGSRIIIPLLPLAAVDEVICVDGGSTDGTVQFMQQNGIRVVGQSISGRGEAFRVAFRETTGDALLFFSPDGNETPEDIKHFRKFLEAGNDLVIATRMVAGAHNEEDDQFWRWRKWANHFFNYIANLTWNRGPWISDTINGYRAITRNAWEKLQPDGSGYTIEYQSSIRAMKLGLRVAEFPTNESSRIDQQEGSPSIQTGIAFIKLYLSELRRSLLQLDTFKKQDIIKKTEVPMSTIEPESLLAQLQWRYAVKKFDANKKITAPLWTAIENSLVLTPSSYGLQPWKFIVVQSSELRTKLKAVSWNQTQVEDSSHYVIFTTLRAPNEDYIEKYINRMAEVRKIDPKNLDAFKKMLLGDIVNGPRSYWVKEWSARQAYIALGNAMTTAALLGIDTCPMEGFEPEKYEELLNLKNSPYQVVVCCAFGYRHADDQLAKATKVRFSNEQMIEYR